MSYKYNKKVFNIAILIMIAYLVVVIVNDGWQNRVEYFECVRGMCSNPYYNQCIKHPTICLDEYLPEGFTYGEQPSVWFQYADIFFLLVVVGAFITNHYLMNRGGNNGL